MDSASFGGAPAKATGKEDNPSLAHRQLGKLKSPRMQSLYSGYSSYRFSTPSANSRYFSCALRGGKYTVERMNLLLFVSILTKSCSILLLADK